MAGAPPSGCSLVPTSTSFGLKATESLITVPQTFTFTSNLPPRQTVKQTVTLSCTTDKLLNIPVQTRCAQVPIETTIMIPGGQTTIFKTMLSTGTTEVTITAPLTTLFSTACASQTTPPVSSVTLTTGTTTTQDLPSTQTNQVSSTPPASSGSEISNSIPSSTASSTGPSGTAANNNGASTGGGGSSGTVIGGVIAGVIAAAILCGLIFCVVRRNRRRRFNEELQYEREVQGRYGTSGRMELDEDLGEPYDPYNMLSHDDVQPAPVPMVDRQTLINRGSRAYHSPPSAGPYSADHGYSADHHGYDQGYDQGYEARYSAYAPPPPPGGANVAPDQYYDQNAYTHNSNPGPAYPSYAPEFASDPTSPGDAMSPRSSGVPEGVGSLAAAGGAMGMGAGAAASGGRRRSLMASQSSPHSYHQQSSPTARLGQSQASHAGSDPFATTEDHNHEENAYGTPGPLVSTVSPAERLRGGGGSGLKVPGKGGHESVGYSLDDYTYNRDTMMSTASGMQVQGPWQTEMQTPGMGGGVPAGAGAGKSPLKVRNDGSP